jgi:hypothetical protein
MAESPRRVDLRLTIPTAAPFRALAAELTQKFAEYVGAEAGAAKKLAAAVDAALGEAQPGKSIDMEMSAGDRELVVTSNSGQATKRSTCPLPD